MAACSAPIKASMLCRFYKQGVAQGDAGVNAMNAPATEFVTFADENGSCLRQPIHDRGHGHRHGTQFGGTGFWAAQ
jgi:hypothetical protein